MYHGITVKERAARPGFLDSLPKSLEEARKIGSNYYYPDRKCANGHKTYYIVSRRGCAECLSAANKKKFDPAYHRAWRKTEKGAASIKAGKLAYAERDPKWNWAINRLPAIKKRAIEGGIAFDLDTKYLYEIAPNTCPILGTTLVYYGVKSGGGMDLRVTPSVDRKDPKGGYTKGNVAVVSMFANTVKSNATVKEIESVLRWMRTHC